MKKTKLYTRRRVLLLMVTLLLLSTILSACSSSAAEPIKKEETAKVEQPAKEVVEEVKEEEPAAEPEATPEPTPETVNEQSGETSLYDGIDMESTLPGTEWILGFKGIIAEPKLVIFNDETNKKVIVEEGEEVEFALDDTLAVYLPEGAMLKSYDINTFTHSTVSNPPLQNEVSGLAKLEGKAETSNIVVFNDEDITLTATLIFVE